jgi:beta-glucosidase
VHSKPSVLPESAARVSAIVEAFNPGMRGGRAVADLLLGNSEPSGRLPVSVPRHVGQQPVHYNQVRGQHGARYADLTQEPLFLFGDGLSYTTIEYRDLRLSASSIPGTGEITATVTLANTGSRPALETVQVYLSDLVTSATWAEQELKGFRQALVEPGATVDVHVTISAAACTIVDVDGHRVVEPGRFELRVGPSSRRSDHLVTTFAIEHAVERTP